MTPSSVRHAYTCSGSWQQILRTIAIPVSGLSPDTECMPEPKRKGYIALETKHIHAIRGWSEEAETRFFFCITEINQLKLNHLVLIHDNLPSSCSTRNIE